MWRHKPGKIALSLVALVTFALACSAPSLDPSKLDIAGRGIIGGTVDESDSSIMVLLAVTPSGFISSLCTAELISPKVLVTAAHCVAPNATISQDDVFLASAQTNIFATPLSAIRVESVAWHPQWDDDPSHGFDIGVAVLARPVNMPLIRFNKQPITADLVGAPVRIVGYGVDDAATRTGAGIRRQATSILGDYDEAFLEYTDPMHRICFGDSGGAGLMNLNGRETLVGITSATSDLNCSIGFASRSDIYLDFLGPYVNTFFTASLYRDLLGRPAEDAELLRWTYVLDAGSTRFKVARKIIETDEYMRSAISA